VAPSSIMAWFADFGSAITGQFSKLRRERRQPPKKLEIGKLSP